MQRNWIKRTVLLTLCAAMLFLSACRLTKIGDASTSTVRTVATEWDSKPQTEQTAPPVMTTPAQTTTHAPDAHPAYDRAQSLIPSLEKRFFLTQLDEARLSVFCDLYEAAMAFETSAKFETPLEPDELSNMMLLLNYTCPELMQISGEYSYSTDSAGMCTELYFTYIMQPDDYQNACNAVEAQLTEWQVQLAGQTDFEKERFVYEYIINNTQYDERAEYAGSCYGVFVTHVARCEGYAKSFMWAMWALDIPCMSVTGDAANGDAFIYPRHCWNIVQIDGVYAYVDATYDDVEQGGEQFPVPYAFFNVDENAVAASRETESIYLELGKPTCSSMALSFHEQRGVYYRSDGTAPYDILADAMSKAQTQDGERAYLKTETDEQFCAISDVLDELLTCWLDENYGNPYQYHWYSYQDGRAFVIDVTR